ncbi:hypothetical protein QYM36_016814 [Artemia franciscana]|uniref:SHC-transforming protein 1 n=1 Tax=Artemia franciscana TaxID=6661 RepID=A0AA88HFL9_ARTSF|nr:hypothetical protein QYM36_016814 [Artemia franciscana]
MPFKTDRKLLKILGERPVLTHGGNDVILVVNSTCLKLTTKDGVLIACHEMPNISFASGGDPETLDFVAYVAKDSRYGRSCFVLKCAEGLAQDVITTVGQAFELRFKEYLKRAPKCKPEPVEKPPLVDPDYYNDLPGKVPPELTGTAVQPPIITPKNPPSSEISESDDTWSEDKPDAIHPRISPQPPRVSPLPSTSSQNTLPSPGPSFRHNVQRQKKEGNLIDFSSEAPPMSLSIPKFVGHDYINTPQPAPITVSEDPFDTNHLQSSLPTPLVPPPKTNHPFSSTPTLPEAHVSSVAQKSQLLQEAWYHGGISRKDAEVLLRHDGEFLVRESQGTQGQYVLSGVQNGNHKHLLLVDPEGVVSCVLFFPGWEWF